MSIGFALNEEYLYDECGVIINGGFVDYPVPTALDLPLTSEFRSILAPDPLPDGPYGAKGVAHPGDAGHWSSHIQGRRFKT